jgi:agmatinase
MWSKNVETFLCCGSEYAAADIVLFGAPFDGTASYRPGTRFGPSAIRHESYGLESYSPYLDRDLADASVFDGGDLELCFGNPERVLAVIQERAEAVLEDGKLPFLLGGEHLVTLGAVRAAARRFPELRLVHFDAHADLREEYLGEMLSHASVVRRCHDLLGDGRICQFGIRSGDQSEFAFSREGHTALHPFDLEGLSDALRSFSGAPVYLTVDLDVLDPSVLPGTGTPEAGGVSFEELRKAVTAVCRECRVVGCDVVELSPPYDPSGVSTAVAGKLVREMLLALENSIGESAETQ